MNNALFIINIIKLCQKDNVDNFKYILHVLRDNVVEHITYYIVNLESYCFMLLKCF